MAPKKQQQQDKHAADFEKIIHAGRERKQNEQLAARIFGTGSQRRSSAPLKTGGSLASRVGVKKQRVSSGARMPPAGNINGEWTHDLHSPRGGRPIVSHAPPAQTSTTTLPKTRNSRVTKLRNAFDRAAATPAAQQQMNIQGAQVMTIKGLAGPFVVLAQNFAPGTTAADIESAMTPIGGVVSSCRLIKTHPIVIAEVVFESKDSADRVIETFNQQNADGRVLNVYMKPGGYTSPPTAPRAQRTHETSLGGNSVLVDGSQGFNDPMDTDTKSHGRLYSDNLTGNGDQRRSRNDNRGSRRGR